MKKIEEMTFEEMTTQLTREQLASECICLIEKFQKRLDDYEKPDLTVKKIKFIRLTEGYDPKLITND